MVRFVNLYKGRFPLQPYRNETCIVFHVSSKVISSSGVLRKQIKTLRYGTVEVENGLKANLSVGKWLCIVGIEA